MSIIIIIIIILNLDWLQYVLTRGVYESTIYISQEGLAVYLWVFFGLILTKKYWNE